MDLGCLLSQTSFHTHCPPGHIITVWSLCGRGGIRIIFERATTNEEGVRGNLIPSLSESLEVEAKFILQKAKKGIKRRRISIIGIKLSNDAHINLKMRNSFLVFKRMVCRAICCGYKCE